MTTSYRHGLLDPHPLAAAEHANSVWLGPHTLGVEVTEPHLASRCGLGNIDPQHRAGGGAAAAIETAVAWPLPPPDACLVTIRPDADAFGSMAVLGLRAADSPIGPAMQARIALIARSDCFDHGAWPGRRDLPESADSINEIGPGVQDLGALITGLSDRTVTVDAGVAAAAAWIIAGTVPAVWHQQAVGAGRTLFMAWQDGRVRLTDVSPGRIAVVEGCVPGGLRLGYRLAPVVVAIDKNPRGNPPAPWRRIAIAQWRVGHVDLIRAAALLRASEPGWGGSPGIIGSPQGRPCRSALAEVLDVLRACGA
nr:hypothetical protein [uncultured Rhodopila sp.]